MRGSSDLLACQVLVLIEDLANMWLDDHVLNQSESSHVVTGINVLEVLDAEYKELGNKYKKLIYEEA